MTRRSPYLIQAAANAGIMMTVVYIPLLARDMGATRPQIGLLVGTYQAATLVSNLLFGRWADFGDRKKFVVFGVLAAAVAVAAHVMARNLAGLFVVRAATGLCVGTFPAALVAYYYDRRQRLGRFTGFGSLGWGIGAVASGAVAAAWLFPLAAVILGLTAIVAVAGLKSQHVRLHQPFLDARVVRHNWHLYLSFYLRHTGASSIWAIFPVFLSDLGASRFWVGLVFALNPFSQVVFMNLLERFNSRLLVQAGLSVSVVVFASYALAASHWWVIPIQIGLALSWGLLYLGAMKRLMERNPERSTAAGTFQSTFGLASVTGALLTGVTGAFGYAAVMLVAAGLALAGTVVFLYAPRGRAESALLLTRSERRPKLKTDETRRTD